MIKNSFNARLLIWVAFITNDWDSDWFKIKFYAEKQKEKQEKNVLCWFDDKIEDLNKAYRRLAGVTFPSGVTYVVDETGKRTYVGTFKAKYGKLE